MRNLKKFLALLLAVMMVATAGIMVSAEETEANYDEAVAALFGLKVLKGYDEAGTELGREDPVQRYQMALLLARMATGLVNDEYFWEDGEYACDFEDVKGTAYAEYAMAITLCENLGIIKGVSEQPKLFDPAGQIDLDEALTMVSRAVGYTSDVWPFEYRLFASEVGLLDNLGTIGWKDELNREQICQILFNLIRVLSGVDFGYQTWDYAGDEYFLNYTDLEVKSEVVDAKFVNNYYLGGKVFLTLPCEETTAAADAYFNAKGEEIEAPATDYVIATNYALYDDSVAAIVYEGEYVAPATVKYGNGETAELATEDYRFVKATKADDVVTLEVLTADETKVTLVVNNASLKGAAIDETKLVANKVYTFVFNADNEAVAVVGTTVDSPEQGLAILTGITLEEVDGEYTGNLLATVLFESAGFEGEQIITVRSIASAAFNYENEWDDTLAEDLTVEEILARDNALFTIYTALTTELATAPWLIDVEKDIFGVYDVVRHTTFTGDFITVNEYSEKNVLSYVDGMTRAWDADKKEHGDVTVPANNNGVAVDEPFFKWDAGDAKGEWYTLSEDTWFVVVNAITGEVTKFQNEPMQGQWITGEFAYDTVTKTVNGEEYCVVVVSPTDEAPFDLAPRAQYVQIDGLKGYVKMNKGTFTLGGINIPLYTYDYTVSGMTDVATGEAVTFTFEGLTEAQFAAVKTQMSIWDDYSVVNEFIYKLYTNDMTLTEKVVPAMFLQATTWAEYWEEYDVYEATMSWVDGTTLLNHQDLFFEMFDLFEASVKDRVLDDYAVRYEDLEAVAYLAYPGLESDAISKYYTYDVGLTYDETNDQLVVTYKKVGAWVELGNYYTYADNGDKITNNYSLIVNMPGYLGLNNFVLTTIEPEVDPEFSFGGARTGAYLPIGTTFEVVADQANVNGTAKGDIYIAGQKKEIELKGGVIGTPAKCKVEGIAIPHSATVDLADAIHPDNTAEHEAWIQYFGNITNLAKGTDYIDADYTNYLYWTGHDDLEVYHQTFDLTFLGEIVADNQNKWYVDIDTDFEQIEKWDTVNVVDWTIKSVNQSEDDGTAWDAKTERTFVNIVHGDKKNVVARWYTYGYFVDIATGERVIPQDMSNSSVNDPDQVGNLLDGLKFVEISEKEYVDGYEKQNENKQIKVLISLRPDYIDLEVLELVKNEGANCGLAPLPVGTHEAHAGCARPSTDYADCTDDVCACGTTVDFLFIEAYEVVDNKLVKIEYDSIQDVYYDNAITGYVNDLAITGGFWQAAADEVKAVADVLASNVYKLIILANRKADIEEDELRVYSHMDEEEWNNAFEVAKDAFIIGATAAYSALVAIINAARKAIMGA